MSDGAIGCKASSLESSTYTVVSSKMGSTVKFESRLSAGVIRSPSFAPAARRLRSAPASSPAALDAWANEVSA